MSGGHVIGLVPCPECGFDSAEVKQDKKLHAYRRCPDCGSNYFTHGGLRDESLRARMRPIDGLKSGPVSKPEPEPKPAPANESKPDKPKKSFLEELLS